MVKPSSGQRVRYDTDVDPAPLLDRPIAVIGFGSQGRAHALNLHDRGADVRVGVRDLSSESARDAQQHGLAVRLIGDAVSEAGLVAILVPDTAQPTLYRDHVEPAMPSDAAVLFAHGFNIRFNTIDPAPTHDVIMVAPKAPGTTVRTTFADGAGIPSLIAVERDVSGQADTLALAYAWGIGSTRAGVLDTTFAAETESDLFGEQVVLVGGLTALVRSAWEVLVEADYSPELAYFECLHELKLVTDLMYREGLAGMYSHISETARYGGYTRGTSVITDESRQRMRSILTNIQDGSFATEWIAEDRNGRPNYRHHESEAARHPIEEVGTRLRSMMPFLSE